MNFSMPLAANFASSDGSVIDSCDVSTTSGPLPVNSMNAFIRAPSAMSSQHQIDTPGRETRARVDLSRRRLPGARLAGGERAPEIKGDEGRGITISIPARRPRFHEVLP